MFSYCMVPSAFTGRAVDVHQKQLTWEGREREEGSGKEGRERKGGRREGKREGGRKEGGERKGGRGEGRREGRGKEGGGREGATMVDNLEKVDECLLNWSRKVLFAYNWDLENSPLYGVAGCPLFRGCLITKVNGRTVGTFRIGRYIVGVRC